MLEEIKHFQHPNRRDLYIIVPGESPKSREPLDGQLQLLNMLRREGLDDYVLEVLRVVLLEGQDQVDDFVLVVGVVQEGPQFPDDQVKIIHPDINILTFCRSLGEKFL